ncbi:hypothetical protein [Roseovarius sp. D22-M7]|uniref:hypothetical protein n=1 Tax=Roseovarius sp. D22-M7 TaxID=3127116 RepID=UPI0030102DAD
MHRSVIALILASAMAMTTLDAAPAAAGDRSEVAAATGGAAILVLLAAAIAKKKRQDSRDRIARQEDKEHRARRAQAPTRDHRFDQGYRAPRRGHDAGYRRATRIKLPGACRVRNDRRAGYSGRCLQRYDYDRAALPSACAIRVGGSHRMIYRDRCLSGYGFY